MTLPKEPSLSTSAGAPEQLAVLTVRRAIASPAKPSQPEVRITVEAQVRSEMVVPDLAPIRAAVLDHLTRKLTKVTARVAPDASGQSRLVAESALEVPPELATLGVDSLTVAEVEGPGAGRGAWMAWNMAWEVCAFQLDQEGPLDDDEAEDGAPAFREWALPSQELQGLWGSLVFEGDAKPRLLSYARSALAFGAAGVDASLLSLGRLVLLHGPPGTGKTTLARALAQKLAIRLSASFPRAALFEVSSHSLFSRYFSESGKLVAGLFARIAEAAADGGGLVFVLVDEVESLAAARQAAIAGSEPGDAVRAVNALLTALDGLRRLPNVLTLSTSNITSAIDPAFLDRADIKAYVGPPSEQARYEILRSCVAELQRAGIVDAGPALLPYRDAVCAVRGGSVTAAMAADGPGAASSERDGSAEDLSGALVAVARDAAGLSGRALRRLPFLAHVSGCFPGGRATGAAFLSAMAEALQKEAADAVLLDTPAGESGDAR